MESACFFGGWGGYCIRRPAQAIDWQASRYAFAFFVYAHAQCRDASRYKGQKNQCCCRMA